MHYEYDVFLYLCVVNTQTSASETIKSKNSPDDVPDREKNSVIHRAINNHVYETYVQYKHATFPRISVVLDLQLGRIYEACHEMASCGMIYM
jgi:hypothetical protein